jgi:hypothetical protein
LLFGKIWERLGIGDVLSAAAAGPHLFEFAEPLRVGLGSHCSVWMEDYDIAGAQGLGLHHFHRAMAWLGEEIDEKGADALAPRCVKDAIEETLFEKRRDLFSDLSVVFMDTTSLTAKATRRSASMAFQGFPARSEVDDTRSRRRRRRPAALRCGPAIRLKT